MTEGQQVCVSKMDIIQSAMRATFSYFGFVQKWLVLNSPTLVPPLRCLLGNPGLSEVTVCFIVQNLRLHVVVG